MTTLIDRAAAFAREAHAGQPRKFVGGPYFAHVEEVAEQLRQLRLDDEVIAAGYLHDVAEDCDVSVETLSAIFGERVARLVEAVTKAGSSEATLAKLAAASGDAQSIKLADILSNIATVVERDAEFAREYLPKKAAQVAVLKRANPTLLHLVQQEIAKATRLTNR
jgi:(p)ppGpp synthase/HD superfamily hydrolase